jgi:purine-nucleoside phosphorylase
MRSESEQAASIIRSRAGDKQIDVALVLGTGLGAIAEHIAAPTVIPYDDLPGFTRPMVGGHDAELVIGSVGTAGIAVMKGRMHHYETGDVAAMRVPLETMALLDAQAVVLTNAAGSTRPELKPGSLVAIRDHINLTGQNPLIGETGDARFVDLTAAYDQPLRERFAKAAAETGRRISEGVYMWRSGPSFETPAEIQVARMLGADLVGMSTVPEVIMARHLGLRVLAISMVTNFAAGLSSDPLSHAQTMRAAAASIVPLTRVLLKFFEIWVLERRAGDVASAKDVAVPASARS